MVDSISIIGPGWRATNSSGQIITDGVLEFFDAGTSNEREVYSDSSLSTSLGTTVDCNSGGYPVTSGNARTLIYTGNTAYKVQLTSAIVGGVVWSHDNVLGALDTSGFLTEAAIADQSLVNISANRSITTADKGKLINVNCSASALTMTLDDAATLGDGFFVGICHDGTANQVLITGDGTDTFRISGANVTGFALTGRGQGIWITCDGTNFKTHSMAPPLISGTNGVILIADRLSTPAVSPTPGARYIVGSSPTGAWSGFAQHDIAEANGFGGWFNYTPATDCGWLAYVQDEDEYYSFVGSAWVLRMVTPANIDEYAPGTIIAIINDQKAQNTVGQTLTSGADRTRDLTTLAYNRDSLVSLSSNQFTLPAGTWEIEWWAQVYDSSTAASHQSLLHNASDTSDVARGTVGYIDADTVANFGSPVSTGSAVVTIASSKAFEIRHRVGGSMLAGRQGNFGAEVYTRVIVRRA